LAPNGDTHCIADSATVKHPNLRHTFVDDWPETHVYLAAIRIYLFRVMRYTGEFDKRIAGISFCRQPLDPKSHPSTLLPNDFVVMPRNAILDRNQMDGAPDRGEIDVEGGCLRPA
jgi:hypothetical protein